MIFQGPTLSYEKPQRTRPPSKTFRVVTFVVEVCPTAFLHIYVHQGKNEMAQLPSILVYICPTINLPFKGTGFSMHFNHFGRGFQVQSMGAKWVSVDFKESGEGTGGSI